MSMAIPPPKRPYTGVDKLLMAAMMDESAAAVSLQMEGYMPSGRGIGYFGSSQDSYTQIPTPSNKSELELYWVLERANLLNYFGTFLNFGGDDVQQLSDADEEEFLEIMSLVGMTQKPLHVRRLQKALIEWRENREASQIGRNINSTNSDLFRRPPIQLSNANVPTEITTTTTTTTAPKNSASGGGGGLGVPLVTTRSQPSTVTTNHPSSIVESPPSNPTASPARSTTSASDSQQYALPHELFVGAPKRPRLMDNLHKSYSNSSERSPCKSDDSEK